jgi:hypothetical protein
MVRIGIQFLKGKGKFSQTNHKPDLHLKDSLASKNGEKPFLICPTKGRRTQRVVVARGTTEPDPTNAQETTKLRCRNEERHQSDLSSQFSVHKRIYCVWSNGPKETSDLG